MKIKQKICKKIRKKILLGELNPGERLIEANLSKKYGVSRGSIREALTMLNYEGFVTLVPNKGATVAKTTAQDLVDYYHLLALLESKAVEWAAHNMNKPALDELTRINNSIRTDIQSHTTNWPLKYVERNVEFHRIFWETCGNQKLTWMVQEIRQKLFRHRYIALTKETYREYLDDHDTIIKALKQKKAKVAARAMEDHILKALSVIKDITSSMSKSIEKMNR